MRGKSGDGRTSLTCHCHNLVSVPRKLSRTALCLRTAAHSYHHSALRLHCAPPLPPHATCLLPALALPVSYASSRASAAYITVKTLLCACAAASSALTCASCLPHAAARTAASCARCRAPAAHLARPLARRCTFAAQHLYSLPTASLPSCTHNGVAGGALKRRGWRRRHRRGGGVAAT